MKRLILFTFTIFLISGICYSANNAKLFYGGMPFRILAMLINPDKDVVEGMSGFPNSGTWIGDFQYVDRCGVNAFTLDRSGLMFPCVGDDLMPSEDMRHGLTIFAHLRADYNKELQPIICSWDFGGDRAFRLFLDSEFRLVFEVMDYRGVVAASIRSRTPLSLAWETIGVVWDGTQGNRAFIDNHCVMVRGGQEWASETKICDFQYTSVPYESDLQIGYWTRRGAPCNWFSGEIAYIGVCDFAATFGATSQLWQLQSLWEGYCE